MILDGQTAPGPALTGDVIARDVPRTQPPTDATSEAAALLTCCQSGRNFHLGCLSPEEQLQVRLSPGVPCTQG